MLGVVAVDRAPYSPLPFRPRPRPRFYLASFPSKLVPFNSSSSPAAHGKTLSCNRPARPSILANSASNPPRDGPDEDVPLESDSVSGDGEGEDEFEIEVENVGEQKNRRRIRSRIRVDADLETVWSVLTDYEGLADFIPSLAVSRLLDKKDKFARLYQVGQQNLALGLKFDAKGVIDCYERDLELISSVRRRRDIDFKMVEGDFHTFEGKWSIEQIEYDVNKDEKILVGKEFQTTLSYVVELVPKLWLPVGLIEGRLCREVQTNLLCVREEAQRVQRLKREMLDTCENREDDENLAV